MKNNFLAICVIAYSLLSSLTTYGQMLEKVQCDDGKYGFRDSKTKAITIPCRYEDAKVFSEGLAAVKLNGKSGFIDKKGNFYTEDAAKQYKLTLIAKAEAESKALAEAKAKEEAEARLLAEAKAKEEAEAQALAEVKAKAKAKAEAEAKALAEAEKAKRSFSYFAKNYVEPRINEWQKKDKFETASEWQQRVSESERKAKIEELTNLAWKDFIEMKSKDVKISFSLDDYDADMGVFLVKSDLFGNFFLTVPRNEARTFEVVWSNITKTPKYIFDNDKLELSEVTFSLPNNGKTYKYKTSVNYAVAKINFDFEETKATSSKFALSDYRLNPVEITVLSPQIATVTTTETAKTPVTIVNQNSNQVVSSDVDSNIPAIAKNNNEKTFAVIIANENYQNETAVMFAKNDGEIFKKYCMQTLGLPEENIHYVSDATLNNIRRETNWISKVANAFPDEANLIFYYAGHGIPDESSKTAYLLPVDGFGSDVNSGYKLDDLYQTLGKLPAKTITVFMDACFSGAQRSGEMMASARGISIKIKPGTPVGNMVVFSAAQGDETAYPYREKGHGLFTYFLLKKLQETKGDVTLAELGNYIITNVKQKSILVNNKSQTPSIIPSATLGDNWKNVKLK